MSPGPTSGAGRRASTIAVRTAVAAVGAWAATVLPMLTHGRSPPGAKAAAVFAGLAGVGGPFLVHLSSGTRADWQRYGRHLGVSAFVGLSLLAWSLGAASEVLAAMDRFRAVVGAIAWAVFAIAWSQPWSVDEDAMVRAPDGETQGLVPRRQPAPSAFVLMTGAVLMATGLLVLAWRIEAPGRGVFAQSLGTASAVAILTAGSALAVFVGQGERRRRRRPIRWLGERRLARTLTLALVVFGLLVATRFFR
ncbi:MAG: hypothetical protein AAGA56_04330 [Myxococcota bacterium]